MDVFPELSLLSFSVFLIYFYTGLSVLQFAPRQRPNQLFFISCMSMAVWALSFAFMHLTDIGLPPLALCRARVLGSAFFASCILHFFYLFTGWDERFRRKILPSLAYLPPAVFLVMLIADAPGTNRFLCAMLEPADALERTTVLLRGHMAWQTAGTAICLWRINRWRAGLGGRHEKTQAKIIFFTGSGSLVLTIFAAAGMPLIGYGMPALLPAATLVWASGIWYAISRYRAMTLRDAAVSDNILKTTDEAIILADAEGRITSANPAALKLLGREYGELVSTDARALFTGKRDGDVLDEPLKGREFSVLAGDGKRVPVLLHSSAVQGQTGEAMGTVFLFTDITEIKKTELLLRQRIELERTITSISTRFINLDAPDIDGAVRDTLEKIGRLTGADRCYILLFSEDMKHMTNTHEWCGEGVSPQSGRLQDIPTEAIGWKDGYERLGKLEPINIPSVAGLPAGEAAFRAHLEAQDIKSMVCLPLAFSGKLTGLIGFDSVRREREWTQEEITLLRITGEIITGAIERERSEEALKENETKYRDLWDRAPVAYHRVDLKGRIIEVNATECGMLGYSKEEMLGRPVFDFILPRQRAGAEKRFLEKISGKSIPQMQERVYVRKDGSEIRVSVHDSHEHGRDGSITGIRTAMIDVTRRARAEKELAGAYERIEKSFEDMVQIFARVAELRDPYTAGHGRRVSLLACMIAEELGMEAESVKCVRLAGTIHDIGKIYVPVEILAKPTSLTELEFNIVKMHPSMAFEILQEIEFPWPIAGIVHQHHERMDGSGYPLGLKGKDILKEASIIGVADVVESMSSFRPYREGLGLESAIAEIKHNRGRLYDAEVARACIALFGRGELEGIFNENEAKTGKLP